MSQAIIQVNYFTHKPEKGSVRTHLNIDYCVTIQKTKCGEKDFEIEDLIKWLKAQKKDIFEDCLYEVDGNPSFIYDVFEIKYLSYQILREFIAHYHKSKSS